MKFKNITENDYTIPGVGLVKAGEIVEMPEGFHNGNFEEIKKKEVETKLETKVE